MVFIEWWLIGVLILEGIFLASVHMFNIAIGHVRSINLLCVGCTFNQQQDENLCLDFYLFIYFLDLFYWNPLMFGTQNWNIFEHEHCLEFEESHKRELKVLRVTSVMMLLVVFLALHQYLFYYYYYFILFLNDHIEIYNNWVNLFLLGFVVVYGSTYSLINILLEGINIDFYTEFS